MHIQIIQFQLSGQRPHRRRRPATAGLRGAASLLRLAASALRERPDLNFEERTIPHVVEALTRTYLADVSLGAPITTAAATSWSAAFARSWASARP